MKNNGEIIYKHSYLKIIFLVNFSCPRILSIVTVMRFIILRNYSIIQFIMLLYGDT